MEEEIFLTIFQKLLILTMEMAAPVLLTSIIVGLLISIVQSVTQIQEATLTFVPKIFACILALIVCMPWMLSTFISKTNEMFDYIKIFIS